MASSPIKQRRSGIVRAVPAVLFKQEESEPYEFPDEKELKAMSQQQKKSGLFSYLNLTDMKSLMYLSILALVVRLAFLTHPSVVIFDEVHFGGFAQKYLTRQFFTDLHPPLARLLVTLSAWIGGFDGKFTFYDIGADYVKAGVPYVTMRAFTAVLGAAVVPIAYATMRAMDLSILVSVVFAAMLLFGKWALCI